MAIIIKTCPYCGKAYSDNLVFCPVDHRPLLDNRVHWDNLDAPKRSGGRIFIKMAAASLAYVPMIVVIVAFWLRPASLIVESDPKPILLGCMIYNFPAISLFLLLQSFNVSKTALELSGVGMMFMWSTFLAWFFWKVTGMFQGDEEPQATRGKYDWVGFQVRFIIGFIVGFFIGWRFVRDTKSTAVVFTACLISGLVGGFVYGLSRPPDFWSRS